MKKVLLFLSLSCILTSIPSVLTAMEQAALAVPAQQEKNVLIFDLGGLFVDTAYMPFVQNAGDGSKMWGALRIMSSWMLDFANPWAIEKRFFATLDQFPLTPEADFKRACKSSGVPMPYALCAYQAGRKTSEEMRAMAKIVCDELSKKDFFYSETEESIIRGLLTGVFTPAVHAESTYILKGAPELLKQVAAQKNPDGKTKKYTIIALSNWDRESFAIVRSMFPDLFSCFDDIVVTGDIGTVKPNAAAFHAVFQRHPYIRSEQCRFFDDQKENVMAASSLGIDSALIARGKVQSLASALRNWGILQ